jgi:hypothetical protein
VFSTDRAPQGRDKIDWKLITNLPVRSRQDAVEKLSRYAMRWNIETFHKILKSGCKAESSRLRTAERIVNLIAVLCILGWRSFWLTIMNRLAPAASPLMALTSLETRVLDRLFKNKPNKPYPETNVPLISRRSRDWAVILLARKDPPPAAPTGEVFD